MLSVVACTCVPDLSVAAPKVQLPLSKKVCVEKLWKEFFSDPSKWWDHRLEKGSKRYPDFKHKETQESLWLNGKWNPTWVEAELATVAKGTLQPSIFSWNQKLPHYNKQGQYAKTLELFQEMQSRGMSLNKFTFVPVLTACAGLQDLEKGKLVHRLMIDYGCIADVFLGNSLINMYWKCGSIENAEAVFSSMSTRSVVSWSSLILGYVKCGQALKALELSKQMQQERILANSITYLGLLNACASLEALDEGRRVHGQIKLSGCESDILVGSSLVDMYCKCGSIEDARQVFKNMPNRNVVTWNAMILGYVKCGQGRKALGLGQQMRREGVDADSFTFVALLNACASVPARLKEGKALHEQILQKGYDSHAHVCTSLVDMYAKCGSIVEAQRVFISMPTRNLIAWNAMILGYVKCGLGLKALELSRQMQQDGVKADCRTLTGLINACASSAALSEGKRVHDWISQCGYGHDIFLNNILIDMYFTCGSVEDAWSVFNNLPERNEFTWKAIISGYLKNGHRPRALELLQQMQQSGLNADNIIVMELLKACESAEAAEKEPCPTPS